MAAAPRGLAAGPTGAQNRLVVNGSTMAFIQCVTQWRNTLPRLSGRQATAHSPACMLLIKREALQWQA